MTEKIKDHHRRRKAILYIRQSSPQQVARNEESRRLQYAMETRLRGLGWEDVEVVDEDLGRSASGTSDRAGFGRMVAEVCLGHVGAVAAREVSRFARNSHDWQQLVEVCRMVDTLLIDQDMVYDARSGNDRLLLGVKGSLNEYELDVLRLRSLEARRQKARRGELITSVPAGYVKTEDDRLEKDPNRRVQEAIGLVFTRFLAEGSARGTLRWFLEQGVELPVLAHGPFGWDVVWKRPTYSRVWNVLTNPLYAGAYSYGKTTVELEYRDGQARRRLRRRPVEEWRVLLYDHHDGYVDWPTYQRIQGMISANGRHGAEGGPGAARRGLALLAGLLRCRRCGRKLTVAYTGRKADALRYCCLRGALDLGEPRCISFGGSIVDEAIAAEMLRVVEPGAVEAARLAEAEAGRKRDDTTHAVSLALQEARFSAERARRQYEAVDPANRLVADELERRWNESLQRAQQLEERLARDEVWRSRRTEPRAGALTELAQRLDRIWNDRETDVRLKKRIARALIEEISVDVDRRAGQVLLVIHWKGGVHTDLSVRCRRRGENRSRATPQVEEAIRLLARTCTDHMIAGVLTRNGQTTGRRLRWTQSRVAEFRSRHEIPAHSHPEQEEAGWMTLTQAAAHLGIYTRALRLAAERGQVAAAHPMPDGPWIFQRDDLDDPATTRALAHIRSRAKGAGQVREARSLFETTT